MLSALQLQPTVKIKVNPQEYLHIAEVIARRFHKPKNKHDNIHDSEIYAEACLSLVKIANEGYNPSINKFESLAYKSVTNDILSYIRKNKRKKRIGIHTELDDKDWRDIPEMPKEKNIELPTVLLDMFLKNDPNDSEQDKLNKILLQEIYINDTPISKIAKKYEVSRVTIYTWLRRIIDEIKHRNSKLIERYGY